MNRNLRKGLGLLALLASGGMVVPAVAGVLVQCPKEEKPDAKCMHLAAGDGFVTMADGKLQYIFGYANLNDVPADLAMQAGELAAEWPAPTIELDEGDELYLTLTNVGMIMRPDLFDPHSVHFHGFPNAAPVFDGEPESAVGVNMGSSLTYYYNIVEPGTYMYHCHVEAAEHMQMGMLGNLYVHPRQNGTAKTYGDKTYTKFAYNDGDGSTGYDVEAAIQLGSFDSVFHDEHIAVQPLPFANMKDDYAMMNGRGYPDTVNADPLPSPVDPESGESVNNNIQSQKLHALVSATVGETILLRLSNLSVTNFYTVTALGLPMKVVGVGARILRGPDGKGLYYDTASVTLGGGEAVDVLVDTRGIDPGTYFLYTTNLNYLSNGAEDFGGMMTEIRIN